MNKENIITEDDIILAEEKMMLRQQSHLLCQMIKLFILANKQKQKKI